MKNQISINQFGYPKLGAKQAFLSGETDAFSLIDSVNNEAVFAGKAAPTKLIQAWGERITMLDFTAVTLSGSFFLSANSGGQTLRSGVFDIATNPFAALTDGIERAIFANRCGFNTADENNPHPHAACHKKVTTAENAGRDRHIFMLTGETEGHTDFSGGYHDTAEYSRNVYLHAVSLAAFIYSITVNENRYATFKLYGLPADNINITESIVNEIKYGLNWLLKMQDKDGGVFAGIKTFEQTDIIAPEDDPAEYELLGKSVYATVAFAGVTALASWLFRKTDEKFAERLKDASIRAWIHFAEYDASHVIDFEAEAKTAVSGLCYQGTCDFDGVRFWALCELYALTGSEDFLEGAKESIPADICSFSPDNAAGFGLLSVFLHPDGGDLELRRKIMFALRVKADNLTSISEKSFITMEDFGACSNMKIMSDSLTLFAAAMILKYPEFRIIARRNLNYILGANPLNKCFVTGFGQNPVRRPRHTLSAVHPDIPPLAGMAVCGANNDRLFDNYLKWQLPRGTPPAKSYGDAPSSLTTNAVSMPATALLYFLITIV
ncbi:MAG: glycoside hydrolase family 9 protein [Ruminococcus sp.]|nr:glycoside hydrolase family 9 protein [Ruminococcus sp.]